MSGGGTIAIGPEARGPSHLKILEGKSKQTPKMTQASREIPQSTGTTPLFGFDLSPAESTLPLVPFLREGLGRGAAGLLQLAERELAAEKRQASNSLVSRLFSSHKKTEATPSWAGKPLLELRQVLQENHPEGRARSLLRLAERYAYDRKYPELTAALLEAAEKEPALAGEVRELRELMSGGGPLLRQLRYEGTHLWHELTSPIALASFGAAVWSARLASAWVVGRSAGYGLGTWAASEAAALAVEVPAMVLSRRVGLAAFVGGENLFSPESIGQELLASYGPFAMLRGGSNAFAFAAPWLRNLYGLGAEGKLLLGTTRFGLELGGVLSGHGINGFLGVENPLPLTENTVLSGLMTVGYMRAAGGILNGLRRYGAPVDVAGEKRARWAEEIYQRGSGWMDGLGAVGDFLSEPDGLMWHAKSRGEKKQAKRPPGGSRESVFHPGPKDTLQNLEAFIDRWAAEAGDSAASSEPKLIRRNLEGLPEYFIAHLTSYTWENPLIAKAVMVYLRLVFPDPPLAHDPLAIQQLERTSLEDHSVITRARLDAILFVYTTWGKLYYPEDPPLADRNFNRAALRRSLSQLPVPVLQVMAGPDAAFGSLFFLLHRLGLSKRTPPLSSDFPAPPPSTA
jgi:hypothetical protein